MKTLPVHHLVKPSGLRGGLHPSIRNSDDLFMGIMPALTGSFILGVLATWFLNSLIPGEAQEIPTILMLLCTTSLLLPFISLMMLSDLAVKHHSTAMAQYADRAGTWASSQIHHRGYHAESIKLESIIKMDGQYEAPRRLMLVRIADAERVLNEALSKFGTADKEPALRIYAKTVADIVNEASAEIETMRIAIESDDRTRAGEALEDLSFALQDSMRLQPGSATIAKRTVDGSPRIAHLTAIGEKALLLDADIVDSAGSRIDVLVRDHLPRLLTRYADLSMVPGGSPEDDRKMLNQGVAMIARSIDEGLASIRTAKADALRSEITFLSYRRGDTPLTAITGGSDA